MFTCVVEIIFAKFNLSMTFSFRSAISRRYAESRDSGVRLACVTVVVNLRRARMFVLDFVTDLRALGENNKSLPPQPRPVFCPHSLGGVFCLRFIQHVHDHDGQVKS